MRSVRLAVLIPLLITLAACGGGGGGGPAEPEPTVFHYSALGASGVTGSFRESNGEAVWHADGTFVADFTLTINGSRPDSALQEGTLTVDEDGRAAVEVGETTVLEGFASDNGAVVILTTNGIIGAEPGIVILVRPDATQGRSEPDGLFLGGAISFFSGRDEWIAETHGYAAGTVSGDPVAPSISNTEGAVASSLASHRTLDEYSVADGRARIDLVRGFFRGAVTHDGEFLWSTSWMFDGLVETGGSGGFGMVPVSTNASNATLSGRYGLVGLRRGLAGTVQSLRLEFSADGTGPIQRMEGWLNSDGTASGWFFGTTLLTAVNARGEFTIDIAQGYAMHGGLSPSGRYGVLAGNIRDGGAPELWLVVRLAP